MYNGAASAQLAYHMKGSMTHENSAYTLVIDAKYQINSGMSILLNHGEHFPEVGHYVRYNTNGLVYTQFILVHAKSRSRSSQMV